MDALSRNGGIMGSIRKRGKVLEAVSMVMLEEGKVLTKREYEHIETRTPIRAGLVLNFFGSWSRMLSILEALFQKCGQKLRRRKTLLLNQNLPRLKQPKPAPKAAVKPAVKPAVKEDKDDE